VPPPTRAQLERLLATLTRRIARHLVRRGWLAEDAEGAQLTGEDLGDSGLGTLRAHSITYRIAVGPNAGRKALTLRTLPGRDQDEQPSGLLAKADGFSLHAGVTVGATDTAKPAHADAVVPLSGDQYAAANAARRYRRRRGAGTSQRKVLYIAYTRNRPISRKQQISQFGCLRQGRLGRNSDYCEPNKGRIAGSAGRQRGIGYRWKSGNAALILPIRSGHVGRPGSSHDAL
jgi:hypothetical protein